MAAVFHRVRISQKFFKDFNSFASFRTKSFDFKVYSTTPSSWSLCSLGNKKLYLASSARRNLGAANQTLKLRSTLRHVAGARCYSQAASDIGGSITDSSGSVSHVNPFVTETTEQTVLEQISSSPEIIKDIAEVVTLGEPSISSLGLGGWTPIGLVQHVLELLHTYGDLPWIWSIVAATLIFRSVMFPLIVKAQANTVKLNNIKPQLDKIQAELKELMNSHDELAKAAASQKLKQLYKDYDCHPVKSLVAPLVQLPLFLSFFVGLRRMANLPVESLQTGGIWWFQDLTACDPYFVLPIVASFSMLASIELGGEVGVNNPNFETMKNGLRGMAVIMIPLTAQFPAAVFTYWIASNIFTLGQVSLLKIPAVRKKFGIPEMIVHETAEKKENFWEMFKAGYSNAAASANIKHQEKMKRERSKALASGPTVETYDHDPTRVRNNQEVFSAARKKKGNKMKDRPGQSM